MKDGVVPISLGTSAKGWAPDNPFRNLDAVNAPIPVPDVPKVDPESLSPA